MAQRATLENGNRLIEIAALLPHRQTKQWGFAPLRLAGNVNNPQQP
jgi:hypothetical protein